MSILWSILLLVIRYSERAEAGQISEGRDAGVIIKVIVACGSDSASPMAKATHDNRKRVCRRAFHSLAKVELKLFDIALTYDFEIRHHHQ